MIKEEKVGIQNINKPKRTLCVGDIHGSLIALKQILKRAEYDEKEDKLIFLGDYCDGWSQSAEVIDYLIKLDTKAVNKSVFLKGNHDEWVLDWIVKGISEDIWLLNGGESTVNSYIKSGMLIEHSHKKFFANLLPYYIDDNNRGFVHGGFTSKQGLGHEPFQTNYWWDRDMWSLAVLQHNNHLEEDVADEVRSKVQRFYKHKEVFIGHTPTELWNVKPHYPEYNDSNQDKNGKITVPMKRCNVWNMDTGCGWSGKLTIMDIDTKKYFQSDFVRELYPNEKGRF